MSERQLVLLSPYRLPTHHQVILNEDEMAAWLHGHRALWHPAALVGSHRPPLIASSYDYDLPQPGQIFAVPNAPQLFQPEDWLDRVRNSDALAFTCTSDAQQTLDNLAHEMRQRPDYPGTHLFDLPPERVQPFFALGFGYLIIDSVFEAMDHERMLDVEGFWGAITRAIELLTQPDATAEVDAQLRLAAEKLLAAREVLYPIAIHILETTLVDESDLDRAWPAALYRGSPLNVLASAQTLERLRERAPERFAQLREKLNSEGLPPAVEVIGGIHHDRPDAYLPIESQLWNLQAGRARSYDLLDHDVSVYARRSSAYHPHLPAFLQQVGVRHALMLNLDNAVMPNHRATMVNWSAPDGKYIDAFCRTPAPVHQPQTYFNLAYQMNQAITQDTAPTLALIHREGKPFVLYEDWLALSQLAPVLGTFTTFSRYFGDALAGEYAGASAADDFFNDDLELRVNAHRPDPVSGFARFARLRRMVDASWSFAAVLRVLSGQPEKMGRIEEAEEKLEKQGPDFIPGDDSLEVELQATLTASAKQLADRLQARAVEGQPGFLLLNPCGFPRRVALELEGIVGNLPIEAPIKAAQFDADCARLVIEIPPLGFVWIPKQGPSGTPAPRSRLKLADGNMVRNEFFEAEIDPRTGGLRAYRDVRLRINRLGQMLAYNPGSRMEADSVTVTQNGTALGEITTTGRLMDEQNNILARFTQRFRAWASRPILEIRTTIQPESPPTGYPWHSFYSMRFLWGDERATLYRGVNATPSFTYHTRPVSPDYVEIRGGKMSTLILSGGLPFFQRHGTKMLDLILIPEGETQRTFDVALAMDRDYPMQVAQGMISPTAIVPTTKGPPSVGNTAWLFHNDAPNLLLLSMKPNPRIGAQDRSIIARFMETSLYGGAATIRGVRNPSGARTLDGTGESLMEVNLADDAVHLDFASGEVLRVEMDYT